jgi:hypothetical protein
MLPPHHKFRVMCKVIRCSENELVYSILKIVVDSLLVFGSRDGGDGTLAKITTWYKIKC